MNGWRVSSGTIPCVFCVSQWDTGVHVVMFTKTEKQKFQGVENSWEKIGKY